MNTVDRNLSIEVDGIRLPRLSRVVIKEEESNRDDEDNELEERFCVLKYVTVRSDRRGNKAP